MSIALGEGEASMVEEGIRYCYVAFGGRGEERCCDRWKESARESECILIATG